MFRSEKSSTVARSQEEGTGLHRSEAFMPFTCSPLHSTELLSISFTASAQFPPRLLLKWNECHSTCVYHKKRGCVIFQWRQLSYCMMTPQPINVCGYTMCTYFASRMGLILIYVLTVFTLRDLQLELYQYRSSCLCSRTALVQGTNVSPAPSISMAICYRTPTPHAYIFFLPFCALY